MSETFLNKMTTAPWFVLGQGICCGLCQGTPEKIILHLDLGDPTLADVQGIAILRNAAEIQQQRKWGVYERNGFWLISEAVLPFDHDLCERWASREQERTPAEALIAADEWWKDNVDGKEKS